MLQHSDDDIAVLPDRPFWLRLDCIQHHLLFDHPVNGHHPRVCDQPFVPPARYFWTSQIHRNLYRLLPHLPALSAVQLIGFISGRRKLLWARQRQRQEKTEMSLRWQHLPAPPRIPIDFSQPICPDLIICDFIFGNLPASYAP